MNKIEFIKNIQSIVVIFELIDDGLDRKKIGLKLIKSRITNETGKFHHFTGFRILVANFVMDARPNIKNLN